MLQWYIRLNADSEAHAEEMAQHLSDEYGAAVTVEVEHCICDDEHYCAKHHMMRRQEIENARYP